MPYKPAIGHDLHGKPSVAFWPPGGGVIFAVHDAIDDIHLCDGPELTGDEVLRMIERRMEDFQRVPGSRESPRHKIWRHYIAAQGPGIYRRVTIPSNFRMEWNMMFSKMSHHGPAGHAALAKARAMERVNRIYVTAHSIGGDLPTFLADQEGKTYRGIG